MNKKKIFIISPFSDLETIIKENVKDYYSLFTLKEKNDINNSHTISNYILNEKFSLVILNDNIPKLKKIVLINELLTTNKVPIIIAKKNAISKKLTFTNVEPLGSKFGNYEIDKLNNNLELLLSGKQEDFEGLEDVQNFATSLIYALETKDQYSKNHSTRVSQIALHIAKLMNFSETECQVLYNAGLFHDIGKIGISDTILLKKGRLSETELNVVKEHPLLSEKICMPIKAFNRFIPIIRSHHERFDGEGYPDKLKGTKIPLGARIVAIADTFDALTSNRSYREAFEIDTVLQILKDGAGLQWDKEIMDIFLESINNLDDISKIFKTDDNEKVKNILDGTIFK